MPIDDDEPIVMVHCTCPSTGREYWLRVAPEMTDCREALAASFQQPASEYLLGAAS